MTDFYLIAHRCRGEATFDVAERVVCPECNGETYKAPSYGDDSVSLEVGCEECAHEGFWWILSTCGYRAHPWWSVSLDRTESGLLYVEGNCITHKLPEMPPTTLDCFPINSPSHKSPPNRSNDLLAKLNLIPKGPPLRRIR